LAYEGENGGFFPYGGAKVGLTYDSRNVDLEMPITSSSSKHVNSNGEEIREGGLYTRGREEKLETRTGGSPGGEKKADQEGLRIGARTCILWEPGYERLNSLTPQYKPNSVGVK